MGIIGWIIIGGLVGAVAKLLMPGKDPGGFIATVILGILGSVVGGFILGLFLPGRSIFQPAGFIGSVAGAVLLLWLYRRYDTGSSET